MSGAFTDRFRYVMRRIFRRKRDKIIEGCRELHKEELHRLYYQIKTRTIRVAAHVAHM
jgi:hypothetical protein